MIADAQQFLETGLEANYFGVVALFALRAAKGPGTLE
jgi:hypothetical protein